jgi:hypothetical protein
MHGRPSALGVTDLISRSGLQERVSCTKHLSRVGLHEIAATMELQECNLLHPRNDYVPSCRLIQESGLRSREERAS